MRPLSGPEPGVNGFKKLYLEVLDWATGSPKRFRSGLHLGCLGSRGRLVRLWGLLLKPIFGLKSGINIGVLAKLSQSLISVGAMTSQNWRPPPMRSS
eukprot:1965700-Pyramimonas_sp.AAC.1